MKARLQEVKKTYTVDYPEAIKFAEAQADIFWTDREIDVKKDIQDIIVNMEPAEKHGVLTTLKLFTLYELEVGDEYWGSRIRKMFPRPDIRRMANCFAFFELNSHAPFYAKINEELGVATDEFYSAYLQDEDLSTRMDFIADCLKDKDDLFALAVFSMVEGVILYSNFAFLKHFQTQGKNKLLNIVRGINFSVRDESMHSEAGAWLYRTLKAELGVSPEKMEKLHEKVAQAARVIYEHESKIIDKIFEKGRIPGITAHQLKCFVMSRINVCLRSLEMNKLEEVTYNPIAEWFYEGINKFQFNDFFTGIGREYVRDWDESAFIWGQVE